MGKVLFSRCSVYLRRGVTDVCSHVSAQYLVDGPNLGDESQKSCMIQTRTRLCNSQFDQSLTSSGCSTPHHVTHILVHSLVEYLPTLPRLNVAPAGVSPVGGCVLNSRSLSIYQSDSIVFGVFGRKRSSQPYSWSPQIVRFPISTA